MIVDKKEITAVELARLIELLGGSVENNNTEPFDWISLPGSKTTVSRVESNLLFGVDNDFAILVANRLAAMNAKGPVDSKIMFFLHTPSDPGYVDEFGTEKIFVARIERNRDGESWNGRSPDLAEAVLAAAIRWTRAVMEGIPPMKLDPRVFRKFLAAKVPRRMAEHPACMAEEWIRELLPEGSSAHVCCGSIEIESGGVKSEIDLPDWLEEFVWGWALERDEDDDTERAYTYGDAVERLDACMGGKS